MMLARSLCSGVALAALAALTVPLSSSRLFAADKPAAAPAKAAKAMRVPSDAIGGVVTSANGPEAGVWVIAETDDLPTKFIRIVVTDDQGRYLVPDLPKKAHYQVWVRGYGLVDSAKTAAAPGAHVDLTATVAPDRATAAKVWPAEYWFSMLKIPPKSDFDGAGTPGAKMPKTVRNQYEWLDNIKTNGCVGCHQLGEKATREIPAALGTFKTGAEAWERRIQSGQASESMIQTIGRFNVQVALGNFGDWSDRVAKGELPKTSPERPQGVERNVVVTMWDWGTAKTYLHDEISTDKRNPTVNGYGKLYGTPEVSTDDVPVLDPVHSTVTTFKMPYRDPNTPTTKTDPEYAPSPYWGDERIWDSHDVMHNAMFDKTGRVWFTSRIRPSADPAFCKQGSDNPSAKLTPIATSGRQLSMYDPKTGKITLIDTCFGTHHIQFGFDKDNTIWLSQGGAGAEVGWLDSKVFDQTHDEQKAQGWTAIVIDTDGTGKRTPTDKVLKASLYGIAPSPVDGSIWGSVRGFPGGIVRIAPGDHPPETALSEYYELPWNDPKQSVHAYGPRGMDIDSQGVVWVPLSSGHLGSFDRRKCKGPLNGPDAINGKLCPEGWSFYQFPGPQFDSVSDAGSVESSYYTWVDQHDTLGLGKDTPVATGDESDSLIAFANGKMVTMRVPYPLGFYEKGLDGRIDDPKGGWKGRGLWTSFGSRTPAHMETGKGTLPKVAHFQIRPNPLAD